MRLQRIVLAILTMLTSAPLVHAQSVSADGERRNPAAVRLIAWRDTFGAWRRSNPALFGLYASYTALEIGDVHSTRRALGRGEVESNAVMRGLAGHTAAFTLVKMGGAASTMYLVERVRRHSRKKAMLLMIGIDSAYGAIVARNYHR
jgi:hypothetical protein